MFLRVEGWMVADATDVTPSTLVIEAGQRFLSDGLDRASVIVHGGNSHGNQPQLRPAGLGRLPRLPTSRGRGCGILLGVWHGTAAILGGTEIFGLFLPRYDAFHLSRVVGQAGGR